MTPTNVSHIKELVMLGNYESVTTWAIGLDSQRPFRVTTLDAPPRLVIDISTA
ncbi:MAG: AMIN-like domain-containing (lipo)protein [Ilumatobacteraceae bacterium]